MLHFGLHRCLLLSKGHAVHRVSAVQRFERLLLRETNALYCLPSVQRHLRPLLPEADAVPLPTHCPAGSVRDAVVFRFSAIARGLSPSRVLPPPLHDQHGPIATLRLSG